MTFALVNYATFDASFSRSPGWRPTFKYYNKWLSLLTCVACLAFMFSLDWMSAIIVFCLSGLLWLYVFYKKPEVNWGTSGQANVYRAALKDALHLLKIQDHVKNYRPQILVLTGLPCVRPALVYMAGSITRATGLMICGHVMVVRMSEIINYIFNFRNDFSKTNKFRTNFRTDLEWWIIFEQILNCFKWNFKWSTKLQISVKLTAKYGTWLDVRQMPSQIFYDDTKSGDDVSCWISSFRIEKNRSFSGWVYYVNINTTRRPEVEVKFSISVLIS